MESKIEEQKKYKAPMVLGIVSLFACIIPIMGVVVSICGIVISKKRLKERKYKAYKIGRILSIIGLVLSLVNWGLGIYIAFTNGFYEGLL